ncbi:13025_t:CDS:2 [Funneliformis mosseae]|uniref:13025_t:CDS:1 n=1 Tax=Funneliformis mosseae TaxID=27381 RepID=A0A9N8ZX57_FUNMO|nr:13025_t:CDS:2 [Funneliformis mosseae]
MQTRNSNRLLGDQKRIFHVHRNENDDKPEEEFSIIISQLYNYIKRKVILYWNKLSSHPKQRHIKITGLSIILLLLVLLLFPTPQPSSFFKRFVDSTTGIFNEINTLDLPASDAIMKHTVSCRRVANMIERSPAFHTHGNIIASNLRNFGETVMIAGQSLRKMYRKGSFVFTSFDIEIDAMMKKLEKLEYGDIRYFNARLNKLADIVKEFRVIVAEASKSVMDAENVRDGVEKYIIEGNREAQRYIDENQASFTELNKAKEELLITNDIMKHLQSTAVHLDQVNKILIDYEDKLMDLSTEMSQTEGKDFLEISKPDLQYLKSSINILKKSHDRFVHKENSINT